MKTYVSVTQQMLDGELSLDEAAEEILKLTPAVEKVNIDGIYYEGEEDNTIFAMEELSLDDNGEDDEEIEHQIDTLIQKVFLILKQRRSE